MIKSIDFNLNMQNLSNNEIAANFNQYKFLIQMLINKLNNLNKKVEVLESSKENNINDEIISIFANYENKIEMLEQRIRNLETLIEENHIEKNIDIDSSYGFS